MKITNRHKRAAFLLAQGVLTAGAIAEELGVTRQAIVKWKRDPDFKRLLDASFEPFIDTGLKEKQLLEVAYNTLAKVMKSGQNEAARVSAAKYAIEKFRPKKDNARYKPADHSEISNILKIVSKK